MIDVVNFTVLQIGLAVAMVFLITKTVNRFRVRKTGFLGLFFWIGVWLCVLMMVFVPDLIGPVSKLIDIRPMSLAVDLSLILAFFLLFTFDTRITELMNDIKVLKDSEINYGRRR